jgi:hypothetical protein
VSTPTIQPQCSRSAIDPEQAACKIGHALVAESLHRVDRSGRRTSVSQRAKGREVQRAAGVQHNFTLPLIFAKLREIARHARYCGIRHSQQH